MLLPSERRYRERRCLVDASKMAGIHYSRHKQTQEIGAPPMYTSSSLTSCTQFVSDLNWYEKKWRLALGKRSDVLRKWQFRNSVWLWLKDFSPWNQQHKKYVFSQQNWLAKIENGHLLQLCACYWSVVILWKSNDNFEWITMLGLREFRLRLNNFGQLF